MRLPSGMQQTFYEYQTAFDHRMVAWKKEVLFTWEWWLGVALTVIPWLIWICYRKRESTDRLFYAGLFVSLISLAVDCIGVQIGAWNYLKPVMPVIPSYIPYNLALLPVIVMLLIQIFPRKNPWLIGLVFGLLTSFIGEPLFKWLKIYEPHYWEHWYSLPIYTVIYFIAYKLSKRSHHDELS